MSGILGDLPPTFTTERALNAGMHPRALYSLRDSGALRELSRGVFRKADAPASAFLDALAVSHRVPEGIVWGLSAAEIYDLTDWMPTELTLAVSRESHTPHIDYPLVKVTRLQKSSFTVGLTYFDAAPGEKVRIYDSARTVVDLLRFRSRFGDSVAFGALHRYLKRSDANPGLLLDYASSLRALSSSRFALDVALAR